MFRVPMGLRCFVMVCCLAICSLPVLAQDMPNVFVQAEVDNTIPFVGQQITYTFTLSDAVGLDTPLYEASDFEGFWRFDWGDVTQSVQLLNGKQYTNSLVKTALFPTTSGVLTIAPAKVILPETVFSSKQEMAADPIRIQVQPLPEGEPQDFSGAVGQFEMSATLSTLSVNLGEPITVHLTVKGTGNIEQLQRPNITLPASWRMSDENPSYSAMPENGLIVGNKDFVFTIFPGESGTQTLPVITLNYFDPATATYRSVSTSPIPLEVVSLDNSPAVSNNNAQPLPGGLAIRAILAGSSISPDRMDYAIWLIPVLIVIVGIFWITGQKKVRTYQLEKRRLSALQSAREKLKHLHREEETNTVSYRVRRTVLEYLTDKLEIPPGHFTAIDIENYLASRNVPYPIRLQISDLISSVSEGLYGPTEQFNAQVMIKQVNEALKKIDEAWKFL